MLIPPPIPPPPAGPSLNRSFQTMVKISGDLTSRQDAAAWVAGLAADRGAQFGPPRPEVLVVTGAGTQINVATATTGIEPRPHGPMGREPRSAEEAAIIDRILAGTRREFESLLAVARVRFAPGVELATITVAAPVIGVPQLNEKLWPRYVRVNGDAMVRACYLGFDELFVLTVASRVEKKAAQFARLAEKVRVIGFEALRPDA